MRRVAHRCSTKLCNLRRQHSLLPITRKVSSSETVAIEGTIPKHGKGIAAGQSATTTRIFTQNDLDKFTILAHDFNPIHDKGMVQGIFAGSMFSCIFGNLIPGCVYKRQTLEFASPIWTGEAVVARIEVLRVRSVREKGTVVSCGTIITDEENNTVFTTGKATVWIPSYADEES